MAATSVSVTVLHSLLATVPFHRLLALIILPAYSELLISLATIHLPFVIKYGKCTGSLYMLIG